MRNISDKSCTGKQNKIFIRKLFYENRAVYEIMWINNVQRYRTQKIILYGVCACMPDKYGCIHTLRIYNTY